MRKNSSGDTIVSLLTTKLDSYIEGVYVKAVVFLLTLPCFPFPSLHFLSLSVSTSSAKGNV